MEKVSISKTLFLGIGNTIRGDDGIGIYIAEEIKKKLVNKKNNVTVISTETAGLNLLELIVGYCKLIIVDSIQVNKDNELGHIYELEVNQINSSNSHFNSHDIDFSKLFKIGKKLGIKLPKEIKIYGIGIFLVKGFGQKCNPRLHEMIPGIAQYIINKELSLEE
ncbi:hydrogenase maturation protease [Candidatus Atribacteria bacterium 1244-E10-H5-B2]|nr:MAG: hydrogenase maturation protease [Candidatus Atribacteria bacterium 1244-E10-H5-B2]